MAQAWISLAAAAMTSWGSLNPGARIPDLSMTWPGYHCSRLTDPARPVLPVPPVSPRVPPCAPLRPRLAPLPRPLAHSPSSPVPRYEASKTSSSTIPADLGPALGMTCARRTDTHS
jgi:hypothetical protein